MKIVFWKSDSFFKITKTLQKIPDGKKIEIDIDYRNEFFRSPWRWQQLSEIITKKNIDAIFIANIWIIKDYYVNLGLTHQQTKSKIWVKEIIKTVYAFVFQLREFQFDLLHKKNTLWYLIFWIEWIVVWLIIYFLSLYLIPSAIITITPSFESQDFIYNYRYVIGTWTLTWTNSPLSIPVYEWKVQVKKTRGAAIQSIRYKAQISQWYATIYNTLSTEYSLKPFTKFSTEEWLLFRTKTWVNVKWWTPDKPYTIQIPLESLDRDEQWNIMGNKANLKINTYLYIKNLNQSKKLKKVYALTTNAFTWGWAITSWVVTQKDLEAFSIEVKEYLTWNKLKLLKDNLAADSSTRPLIDDQLTSIGEVMIQPWIKVWDALTGFEWEYSATIKYHYVTREDVIAAAKTYLAQRQTLNFHLVDIDKTSLSFYEKQRINSWVFIIPTKITILRWYNFVNDPANYQSNILDSISWKDPDQARETILQNPDIATTNIKLQPFRIKSLPSLKSRIKFKVINPTTKEEIR